MSNWPSTRRPRHRSGLDETGTRHRARVTLAAGALALLGSAAAVLPAGGVFDSSAAMTASSRTARQATGNAGSTAVVSDVAVGAVAVGAAARSRADASSFAAPIPAAHQAAGSVAWTGQVLLPGRSLRTGHNRLLLTLEGELKLYAAGKLIWSSDTAGHHRARAYMQPDGNLVLRTRSGRAYWSTRTAGHRGARLLLRRDGLLMVQGTSGRVLWSKSEPKQPDPGSLSVTGYAIAELPVFGWGTDQWPCLQSLWQRESGWNYRAANPSSGAYGIPQALPGSKMASAGSDWQSNPQTQIRWGLGYIKDRYGSPCGAWGHSQSTGWY